MYYDNELNILRAACADHGIDVPDGPAQAEAAHAAAVALRQKIEAETAPTIEQLTVETLPKVHDKLIAWENRDARLNAAQAIERAADGQVREAWFLATAHLIEALRDPFDQAANVFTTTLGELDGDLGAMSVIARHESHAYAKLSAAVATLHQLTQARGVMHRAFGGRPEGANTKLADLGRVLHFPDMETLLRIAGHRGTYDLEWWAAVATTPGVVIKWHTPDEQQTDRDLPNRQAA